MVSPWWDQTGWSSDEPVRRNRLLRALPHSEAARARELLQAVTLRHGQTLQEAGEPLRYIYFPAESLLSTTVAMADGSAIEYGAIGCDGVFGNRFTAKLRAPGRTICQVPGDAFRVRASVFFEHLPDMPVMRDLTYRYGQYLYVTMAQLVACNCLHTVAERCARWLLTTRDCVGRDEFDLTQEFLATMLGVRRASVTAAVGKLQRLGAIKYRRGCMNIVKPRTLERASCECYRVMVENRKLVTAGIHA